MSNRRAATKTVYRLSLRLIRNESDTAPEPDEISRPTIAACFLWDRVFSTLDREAMCALYLDTRNRAIGWTLAYLGCIDRCSVEPRGIIVPALLCNASRIIVAHNHPSGSLEPSTEDRDFTRKLAMACSLLNLKLEDCFIVAEPPKGSRIPRWTSLRDSF